MSKRTLLTILVITTVFLAGALVGAAVVRLVPSSPVASLVRGDDERPPDRGRERERRRDPVYALSRLLDAELDLTGEQRDHVERIIERRSREAREIFRESRRDFREHLDSTVEELKGVLTTEQTGEFEELLDEIRERRTRFGRDRGRD